MVKNKSCKIITVAVVETLRLILKLAVGFHPLVYAAVCCWDRYFCPL